MFLSLFPILLSELLDIVEATTTRTIIPKIIQYGFDVFILIKNKERSLLMFRSRANEMSTRWGLTVCFSVLKLKFYWT